MMEHFLLTRFNLKKKDWLKDKNSQEVLDEEWLAHRVSLFKKYCLPSVLGQTSREFKWLIFFQEDPPKAIRSLVKQLEKHDFIESIFVSSFEEFHQGLTGFIFERVKEDSQWILTTRLDNDDALHMDFMAMLWEETETPVHNTVLQFPNGLMLDLLNSRRLAASHYPLNQFISLLENVTLGKPQTVLCRAHDSWDEKSNVQNIDKKDAWLQIIHSHNMVNWFKGVPVYSSRLQSFHIEKVNFNWDYDLRLFISAIKIRLKKFLD